MSDAWTEVIRRKIATAPEYADVAQLVDARRQRALLEKIIGKRVLDVGIVTDRNGDTVFLIFYGARNPPQEGEACIAGVWLVEQRRQALRLEEVVHRGGAFFLADGSVLAQAVMDGAFAV